MLTSIKCDICILSFETTSKFVTVRVSDCFSRGNIFWGPKFLNKEFYWAFLWTNFVQGSSADQELEKPCIDSLTFYIPNWKFQTSNRFEILWLINCHPVYVKMFSVDKKLNIVVYYLSSIKSNESFNVAVALIFIHN